MADWWADKDRHTETEARWTSLRQRPIFTWTASGIAHRSTMSKVVKTRAHLMAARLQIPEHDNLTAKFLKREGNSNSRGYYINNEMPKSNIEFTTYD